MKTQIIFTDKELKLISKALWVATIHTVEHNHKMTVLRNNIDATISLENTLQNSIVI